MPTILELIKQNAVPASVMRTASKGGLPIPAEEMLEVLVYLTHSPVFAQDARMTLASWDAATAISIVANNETPPEVLGYFWSEQNRRPGLMPALIENPAISETMLIELAGEARREIVPMLLASERVRNSPAVLEALAINPNLSPEQLRELRGGPTPEAQPESVPDPESEAVHQVFQREHAEEIAAEQGKPFQLVEDEADSASDGGKTAQLGVEAPQVPAGTDTVVAPTRRPMPEEKKLTVLQKISRMTASERVKAAFTGSKDERAILVRDGARIVQNAVLASPKLTDPEVEMFAAAKNVHENVLREIARNRRFMKNYAVMRNLVQNPKTPVDIAMPMVKMLMVYDLKTLQRSKNVSEPIRALAAKFYREKSTSGGKTKE